MNSIRNIFLCICILALIGSNETAAQGKLKVICKKENLSPRINYATEQVRLACEEVSVDGRIKVRIQDNDSADKLRSEGFRLKSLRRNSVAVVSTDESGVSYGCLELAEQIRNTKAIPANLDLVDAPEFKLRGPCIGMQKLEVDTYGGHYQWHYTPEYFPFFYDKEHWQEYLDFLVSQRMNSVYLWNGHPFASLVYRAPVSMVFSKAVDAPGQWITKLGCR